MDWKKEWKILAVMGGIFLVCFYLPVGSLRFDSAVLESFHLVKWYAREHVLLCLIPAFFIAGAISVFIQKESVMKYLGAKANKVMAYGVASVSGTILAVCSCTVLPLFAGIYKMGAGLGPASAFLYSGPAINVLAIFLTARVLGLEMGLARVIGAVAFSILVGLLMHFIFRKEEKARLEAQAFPAASPSRPLWQNTVFLGTLVAILIFANWGRPEEFRGPWFAIFSAKWKLTGLSSAFLGWILVHWFGLRLWKMGAVAVPVALLALVFRREPLIGFGAGIIGLSFLTSRESGELGEWFHASWDFAKQIAPLLLIGILAAGLLLGRPGHEGLIPSSWITKAVGGNSLWANFLASFLGALMYFATLTEIPILHGLMGSGMGKGPALALLLAGPALSLPSMLVLRSILGTKKTAVFVSIVVLMATFTGFFYGVIF